MVTVAEGRVRLEDHAGSFMARHKNFMYHLHLLLLARPCCTVLAHHEAVRKFCLLIQGEKQGWWTSIDIFLGSKPNSAFPTYTVMFKVTTVSSSCLYLLV